jgi:predicted LPLAT superfamily acyltransferase
MALNRDLPAARPRNPGPAWGFLFLTRADAVLPGPVWRFFLGAGCAVAVAAMPAARRHSREYLSVVLGRPARLAEVWRHFFVFAESLSLKLRVAEGAAYECVPGADCAELLALAESGQPALFGTFHFGHSDLLGFMLGRFSRRVSMIRLRVDNSRDTDRLARRFGDSVAYLWVNDTDNLLLELKQAVASGSSLALKCDRPGHSAKVEAFDFLGKKRLFPFTIYHLALIFQLPVVLCVSVPAGRNASRVHSSPVFTPAAGSRDEELGRARRHFQEFLTRLEAWLREDPFLWANFTPLNPAADA